MTLFTDGYTLSLNRLLDSLDQRQRAHEGDRTDYELVLVDLHAATFTYAGWHEDMRRVERPVEKKDAYKLLRRMHRRQEMHDGVYTHEGIRKLMTEDFDYPEFEEDREIAKTFFCRNHDTSLERTLAGIFQKQRIFNDFKGNPSKADDDLDICALCMENTREYTFIPCGHMSLCEACAATCLNDASMTRCMTCMNEYTDIIKIYG